MRERKKEKTSKSEKNPTHAIEYTNVENLLERTRSILIRVPPNVSRWQNRREYGAIVNFHDIYICTERLCPLYIAPRRLAPYGSYS